MELTDAEREEFASLANDTFDPDLWDEADLPILRAARAEHEKERAREGGGVLSIEQPTMTKDDKASGPDPLTADDG